MIDKQIIKRNFSKYAEYYDRYANIQNLCASGLIKEIAGNSFKKILDIGCGTGNYTLLIRAKFPSAFIKAIDISREMVALAEKKLSNEQVEFGIADAEELKEGERFDLISSNAAFQWFGKLDKTLAKYKRLLTRRGRIVFSIFGPLTFYELQESLRQFKAGKARLAAANFIGQEEMKNILRPLFNNFKIEQKIYTEKSGSLVELLKKIKYTGTAGGGWGNKIFWTSGTIAKIEKIYRKTFKDIIATYQVFYVQAKL